MNKTEFGNWCKQSDGIVESGGGQQVHCKLDDKIVTHGGDDISIRPYDDAMIKEIEGPADEFFNMGEAQLATEVGDHSLIFQSGER
jgi:hypothetical protein